MSQANVNINLTEIQINSRKEHNIMTIQTNKNLRMPLILKFKIIHFIISLTYNELK